MDVVMAKAQPQAELAHWRLGGKVVDSQSLIV